VLALLWLAPDEMSYYHLEEIKMADENNDPNEADEKQKKVSAMDTGRHGAEIFEN
jgi:hypothetical protein